jgi:hypothetical protein
VLRYLCCTIYYGLTIIEEMEFVWLAIQTRIGKDVSVTGKALQGAALDWDQ